MDQIEPVRVGRSAVWAAAWRDIRQVRHLAGAAAAGMLLASCSMTGDQARNSEFAIDQAQALFGDAYAHVEERFIEPVGMDTIALAGMKRLNGIDGRLDVARNNGAVVLLLDGRQVESWPNPPAQDSDGWANVTARVLGTSRSNSAVAAGLSSEALYDAVMGGVVGALDRHSRYESAESAGSDRASRDGFGGVGVTIRTEANRTDVVEVLPDSPADKAGLMAGDQIVVADGEPLAGLAPHEVIQRLRGEVGSVIVLDIVRGQPPQSLRFSITRAHVVPQSVTGRIEHGVALIRVRSFNSRTAADLEREIDRLQREWGGPLPGLVLDLRNNPGGLLDQAVEVADLFLGGGIVITTRGRHPAANGAFIADSFELARNVPLAILINGRSASAAEMMAAALQDRGRAIVIGSATHGKGSVQNLQRMPNGGELVVTWSRMYTPSGYLLDGLGVLPNICTSVDGGADPLASLQGGQDRIRKQFRDWYRYDHMDARLAGTLRATCPAVLEMPASDEVLAARILLEPYAYRLALSAVMQTRVDGRQARAVPPGASS